MRKEEEIIAAYNELQEIWEAEFEEKNRIMEIEEEKRLEMEERLQSLKEMVYEEIRLKKEEEEQKLKEQLEEDRYWEALRAEEERFEEINKNYSKSQFPFYDFSGDDLSLNPLLW